MIHKSVLAAHAALDQAEVKLTQLREAPTLNNAAALWSEFLVYANRVFMKLEQGAKEGASKGWYDSVKNARKTDPTLCYILHARNSDEHGIEEITERRDSRLSWESTGSTHVKSISIGPNGITADYTGSPLKFTFVPGDICLLPVKDRGVVYDPPLIASSSTPKLISVADAAIGALQRIVTEASTLVAAGRQRAAE